MTDQLTIYFFGVPKILIEGRGAERQPAHKGMLLLAILTTNRGRPMDRTALAYDLWGDVPESRARRNLNTEIWRLRQIMGEAILSETTTVSFSPVEKCRIDIEEFETVDDSSGIESLEAALAVYQGEFLSGYYEDWAVVRREYYQDRYIQYLDRAARLYQSSSTTQKAVEAMKVILQYNPIHEESHQRLMRLFLETGDHAAAVRQYQQCASILSRELGLQPLPETQALYEWIVKQSQVIEPVSIIQPGRAFVGREEDLQILEREWGETRRGGFGSVIVSGESGIGKTRLVAHWLERMRGRTSILRGHCYEVNQRISYHPIIEMLRNGIAQYGSEELNRLPSPVIRNLRTLLPEMSSQKSVEKESSSVSTYAREQVMYSLARGLKAWADRDMPLLIFLDDVQWADDETIDLLSMLGNNEDIPIFLVATYRPESIALSDSRRMESRIKKLGNIQLALNPLTRQETVELIRKLGKMSEAPREFGERIFSETEGNPLFVIESLKGLFDAGYLSTNAEGAWTTSIEKSLTSLARLPISSSLKEAIQKRFDRLNSTQKSLLGAASVIGREFGKDILISVSGIKRSDLDEALPPLLRSGLIEVSENGDSFTFSHVKTQETIQALLEDRERRSLHLNIALYFEGSPKHNDGFESLAFHYFHAGELSKALEYYEKAGEHEMALHANKVASFHFEFAEKLCDQTGMEERRFPLLMKRYLCLWTVESDHDKLQEILDTAKAIAEKTKKSEYLAQACFYRGINLISRGIWEEGRAELARALDESAQVNLREYEMKSHLELANIHGHNMEFEQALQHARAGLDIAKELGNVRMEGRARWEIAEFTDSIAGQAVIGSQLAEQALDMGIVDFLIEVGGSCVGSLYYAGDFGGALVLGERILDFGKERGLLNVLGRSVQRVLARVYCEIGEYERAAMFSAESLRLSRLSGYRYGEMRSLACLAMCHAGMGRYEEALSELNRAAVLCAGINSKGDALFIKLSMAAVLIQHPDNAHKSFSEEILREILPEARVMESAEVEASAFAYHAHLLREARRLDESIHASESAVTVLENTRGRVLHPAPLVYFNHAKTLQAAGNDGYRKPLALARQSLYCRAVSLPSGLRRTYLRAVPLHRAILSMS